MTPAGVVLFTATRLLYLYIIMLVSGLLTEGFAPRESADRAARRIETGARRGERVARKRQEMFRIHSRQERDSLGQIESK